MPKQLNILNLDPVQPIQGVVLAFDFGMKRIGLAVGQTLTKTANPIAAIQAKKGLPQWQALEAIIHTWRPCALVVGIPLNMDGSPQAMSEKAFVFAKTLQERFKLPVHGAEERLTSFAARQQLFEMGGFKAIQKNSVDSLAAKIILEEWFSEHAAMLGE